MRSYHDPQIFFKKMKKKPALQKIIDNIEEYSDQDIEQSGQPKWIREQLLLYKKHGGYAVEASELFTFDTLAPEEYKTIIVKTDFWMKYGDSTKLKKELFIEKGSKIEIGNTHIKYKNERFYSVSLPENIF